MQKGPHSSCSQQRRKCHNPFNTRNMGNRYFSSTVPHTGSIHQSRQGMGRRKAWLQMARNEGKWRTQVESKSIERNQLEHERTEVLFLEIVLRRWRSIHIDKKNRHRASIETDQETLPIIWTHSSQCTVETRKRTIPRRQKQCSSQHPITNQHLKTPLTSC